MTLYQEISPDQFATWGGEPIDDLQHPFSVEQFWSAGELENIGLWRDSDMIAAAEPVPAGKVSMGKTVVRVDGVVRFVHTLTDTPINTRANILNAPKRFGGPLMKEILHGNL